MTEPTSPHSPAPPSICPDCATPLPADSPQALCPTCLMRQALSSSTLTPESPARPTALPPSPEEIAPHFPQLEILKCLGQGGMGVVYQARQKSLNRLVAIKILASERANDTRFAERFTSEAQLLAQLSHPHIVTIHDFGETDGLYFLVMEFVDGVNLRDLISEGKLETAQALAIVSPICEALQYAHEKGIVHRDIKPENLLLDRDGRLKIADFGIASLIGSSAESAGTPPYMAPEQDSPDDIDQRADIYALGVVLYEMLTGERPSSPLDLPSRKVQLDVRIDDIVLRALSEDPERRYQTAGDFQTVVETVSSNRPQVGQPPVPNPPPIKQKKSNTGLVVGIIAALLIVPLLLVVLAAVIIYLRMGAVKTAALESAQTASNSNDAILGWAKVQFTQPNIPHSGGMEMTLPAKSKDNLSPQWFPTTGQPFTGENGKTFLVKTRAVSNHANDTEITIRCFSETNDLGELQTANVSRERQEKTLNFRNGLQANIQWQPALPAATTSQKTQIPLNGIILTSLACALAIAALIMSLRKSQKRGAKRSRGCGLIPILLIVGLLLGLLHAVLYQRYRPKEFHATSVLLGPSPSLNATGSTVSSLEDLRAQATSRPVLETVRKRLGQENDEQALIELAESISAQQRNGTDLIEIRARSMRADTSVEIANTVTQVLLENKAFSFQQIEAAQLVRTQGTPNHSWVTSPLIGAILSLFASALILLRAPKDNLPD